MSFKLSSFFLSDLPFFEHQEKVFSFREVWEISLKSEIPSVIKGEFVGLVCEKGPKTIFALFKLMSVGAIPVLLSPKATPFDIENLKKILQFNIIINPLKIKSTSPVIQDLILFEDDTALICFTSGSSGRPKAVPLSFKNIFLSAKGTNEFYSLDFSDRYLQTLPLNHVGGLMIVFRSLLAQCLCIFPENNKPYSNYRPSILSLVPTQLFRLINRDSLKSCKVILVGGDKVPFEKLPLIKNLPVSLTYGMTETCAQIAASAPFETKMRILPYRQVKISNKGGILVGGDTCFKGYLGEKSGFDHEGFFYTSDYGKFNGPFLEVLNRADDIFIRGGENISSIEIEAAALKLDFIEQAKVIPIDDFEFGQIPILFYQSSEKYSDQELRKKLLNYLPTYKIPHRFIEVPPKNDFKWQKAHLLSLLENSP